MIVRLTNGTVLYYPGVKTWRVASDNKTLHFYLGKDSSLTENWVASISGDRILAVECDTCRSRELNPKKH